MSASPILSERQEAQVDLGLPAVATSWWCFSTRMPTPLHLAHHLGADVLLESVGGTGK
jgi:hypothetical protein